MEAPLKFQAPSVDLATGLEIGRLVFGMLNKMEWVLMMAVLFSLVRAGSNKSGNFMITLIGFILLLQTFYLLPVLDAKAELIIQGKSVEPSNTHFHYVGLELTKLILLGIVTIKFIYNSKEGNYDS